MHRPSTSAERQRCAQKRSGLQGSRRPTRKRAPSRRPGWSCWTFTGASVGAWATAVACRTCSEVVTHLLRGPTASRRSPSRSLDAITGLLKQPTRASFRELKLLGRFLLTLLRPTTIPTHLIHLQPTTTPQCGSYGPGSAGTREQCLTGSYDRQLRLCPIGPGRQACCALMSARIGHKRPTT